jgi:hypothetical protein
MENTSGATVKIRALFKAEQKPFTISEIKTKYPELKASQISMVLCYLMKQRYLSRESIKNPKELGRQMVYQYTYHPERLPKIEVPKL